ARSWSCGGLLSGEGSCGAEREQLARDVAGFPVGWPPDGPVAACALDRGSPVPLLRRQLAALGFQLAEQDSAGPHDGAVREARLRPAGIVRVVVHQAEAAAQLGDQALQLGLGHGASLVSRSRSSAAACCVAVSPNVAIARLAAATVGEVMSADQE